MSTSCFISHPWAKGYHDFAVRLAGALRTQGFRIWIDEEQMLPGDEIRVRIQNGVRHESDIFLFILTPEAIASQMCINELKIASESGKPVVPIMRESCILPTELGELLYADFSNSTFFDAAVDRLVKGIEKQARYQKVVEILNDTNPDNRIKAASILGEMRHPKAVLS